MSRRGAGEWGKTPGDARRPLRNGPQGTVAVVFEASAGGMCPEAVSAGP
ncbi:MAG: hypothetical protein KH745_03280 [Bilophila sp.]|nr:hypothetical protein [Bilophila sp.]